MKRPTKEDYPEFIQILADAVRKTGTDNCFYTYGSDFGDDNFNAGRSDIDGGIVLCSSPIIDKDVYLKLSKAFADAKAKHPVESDINISDTTVNEDGRFLSYTIDFTDWIKKTGKIRTGPNQVNRMNGLNYKSGVLYSAAFNFRSVRNGLLQAVHRLRAEPEKFREELQGALEKLAKFSKKLLWLQGEEIVASRFEAQRKLGLLLPQADLSFLQFANNLLADVKELDSLLTNEDLALRAYCDTVTQMETIIRKYITKFPAHNEREVKR